MKLLNVVWWEKQRAKGMWRFVVITGICRFALPITLLLSALEYWNLQRNGFFTLLPGFRGEFLRITVLVVFLGCPVFGIVWGFLTWQGNEWLYRRYVTQSQRGASGA